MPKVAAQERDRYLQERRSELLHQALALFAERGFDATTMDTLAKHAGVAKGTYYLYFPTKAALREAIFAEFSLFNEIRERLAETQPANPSALVRSVVEQIWELLHEREAFIRFLVAELQHNPQQAEAFNRDIIGQAVGLLAEYFEAEIAKGRLRPTDPVVAAHSLIGMVLSLFLSQRLWGGHAVQPLSQEQVTETISQVFLEGLLTRRPARS